MANDKKQFERRDQMDLAADIFARLITCPQFSNGGWTVEAMATKAIDAADAFFKTANTVKVTNADKN
jgi:hypothetical protein